MSGFEYIETGGSPIKAWTRGAPIEDAARTQIENVARLPFIHKHVAVMPDVHWGMGAKQRCRTAGATSGARRTGSNSAGHEGHAVAIYQRP